MQTVDKKAALTGWTTAVRKAAYLAPWWAVTMDFHWAVWRVVQRAVGKGRVWVAWKVETTAGSMAARRVSQRVVCSVALKAVSWAAWTAAQKVDCWAECLVEWRAEPKAVLMAEKKVAQRDSLMVANLVAHWVVATVCK